jgi:hypothetical protein
MGFGDLRDISCTMLKAEEYKIPFLTQIFAPTCLALRLLIKVRKVQELSKMCGM